MKVAVALIVVAFLSGACTKVESPSGLGQPQGITVRGSGKVEARPDIALLSIGVSTQGPAVEPVRQAAAEAMTSVIESLKQNGVSPDDIQTSQFVVRSVTNQSCDSPSPVPPALAGSPPPATTVCVSNRVEARLRRLETVAKVVDGAIAAGGSAIRVDGLQFTVEKPEDLIEQAKAMAIDDARAQARTVADKAGVRLGRLLSVSTSTQVPTVGFTPSSPFVPPPRTGAGVFLDTPIVTGIFDLVVVASLTYAIR
jgi:uncharacterized protein YggE